VSLSQTTSGVKYENGQQTKSPAGFVMAPARILSKTTELINATTTGNTRVFSVPRSLASQFKTKEGDWSCNACYVSNKSGLTKCAACESPKPISVTAAPSVPPTKTNGESRPVFGSKLAPFGGAVSSQTPATQNSTGLGFCSP